METDEPNLNVKLQFIQVLTNFERGEQVGLISELSLETVWISMKGLTRDILVEEWNEGNKRNNADTAACGLERECAFHSLREQCSACNGVRSVFIRYIAQIIYT